MASPALLDEERENLERLPADEVGLDRYLDEARRDAARTLESARADAERLLAAARSRLADELRAVRAALEERARQDVVRSKRFGSRPPPLGCEALRPGRGFR